MRKLLVAPFMALLLVVGMAGCGTTARDELAIAEKTYTAAATIVEAAVDNGLIKGDQATRVKAMMQIASAFLDAWQQEPDNPDLQKQALAALAAFLTFKEGLLS